MARRKVFLICMYKNISSKTQSRDQSCIFAHMQTYVYVFKYIYTHIEIYIYLNIYLNILIIMMYACKIPIRRISHRSFPSQGDLLPGVLCDRYGDVPGSQTPIHMGIWAPRKVMEGGLSLFQR